MTIKQKLINWSVKIKLLVLLNILNLLNKGFPNNVPDWNNTQKIVLLETNTHPVSLNFKLISAIALEVSGLDLTNNNKLSTLPFVKQAMEAILTALSSSEYLLYSQIVTKGEKKFKPEQPSLAQLPEPQDEPFNHKIEDFLNS
jgi:hypothetical protein